MGKKAIFAPLVLCLSIITMPIVYGTLEGHKEVDLWLENLTKASPKVTRLHFYVHDQLNATNPTSVLVAQSPKFSKSPSTFGDVYVLDDLLTEGPEPTSKPIGRTQGMVAASALDTLSFLITYNFVFTTGKYNGSSLTIVGRNSVTLPIREMTIVGGTGVFRMARGIVTIQTYNYDIITNNGIFEYHVYALHY